MKRGRPAAIPLVFGVMAVAGALYLASWRDDDESDHTVPDAPPWTLLSNSAAFKRAEFPHELSFPEDHGPHPGFRTEWWNLAGNLEDDQGRHLGFQVTIMRIGLLAEPPQRSSRWAATDAYVAVFSASDPAAQRLHTDSRTSRAAIGLAGASAEPRRVWVENWQLKQDAAPGLTLTVQSQDRGVALALTLLSKKPLIDENKFSDSRQDMPFHFYLEPRLRAEGSLQIGQADFAVHGLMFLEHAWGELPLPGGPVALDRFTLHLDDGRELLLSRSHRVDGSGRAETTGILISAEGGVSALDNADVQLNPTDYWEKDGSGARYPLRWSLHIPDHALQVGLSPYYEDQAGVAWLPFWAGPMRVSTQSPNQAKIGEGFMQLTGYEGHD